MKTQKKSWKKPVLIIIGQGSPEERVLAGACKHDNSGKTGQSGQSYSCQVIGTCQYPLS